MPRTRPSRPGGWCRAPKRGELVRLLGEELRAHKAELGRLVSIEVGKIPSEGLGEVQEMIDICDFAVGLSRQLYGLTIATERPGHRMMETWHPLGVVGVISAFNFPVAVWSWNAALALVCGDAVVWKPSEKTPLTALACEAIFEARGQAFRRRAAGPGAGADRRPRRRRDPGRPSRRCRWFRPPARPAWAAMSVRGWPSALPAPCWNSAATMPASSARRPISTWRCAPSPSAPWARPASAARRCGACSCMTASMTRCVPRLKKAYESVSVGNPLETSSLVGPLIDKAAFDAMQKALKEATAHGGKVTGGTRVENGHPDAYYVHPALVEMPKQVSPVTEETFAPILYVMKYSDFDAVLDEHNAVGAGLSSSIFTRDLQESERFLGVDGSDCGIANVNIGTSGAEIGGAFGGEKETGGGRESGSDAWKAYMRRATNTVNYSKALPLAQGVSFDID